jgi:rhodanese-related sulfurtransferase
VKKVLREGALVAVIGALLAFAANKMSPQGIELTRDYFPATKLTSPSVSPGTNQAAVSSAATNSALELVIARLKANGLQLADSNQVVELFHDPRREQDGVMFIDSRDEDHYRAGHIPGAYLFDRFRPENYLTNVVQVCLTAQQIIFYCNGGECDDSLHAAIYLRDGIGMQKEKVFVYGGGFTEWTNAGLPYELGSRNSGELTNVVKSAAPPQVGGPKP